MIEALVVGMLLAVIAFLIGYPLCLRRRPGRRHLTNSAQSGLVRGMDEVWHPEAIAPTAARDEETRLVRPAPAPDPDLGLADGVVRIRIQD
jgi:hypothetical protein